MEDLTLRRLALMLITSLLIACAPARDVATPPLPTETASPTPTGDPAASPDTAASTQPSDTKKTPPAGEVDYTCTTDADCSVKDIGNCCGYYPACVNVDSATFPEQVKAACAESGMASICGFPAITGCQCVEGRCESAKQGPIRLDPGQLD